MDHMKRIFWVIFNLKELCEVLGREKNSNNYVKAKTFFKKIKAQQTAEKIIRRQKA